MRLLLPLCALILLLIAGVWWLRPSAELESEDALAIGLGEETVDRGLSPDRAPLQPDSDGIGAPERATSEVGEDLREERVAPARSQRGRAELRGRAVDLHGRGLAAAVVYLVGLPGAARSASPTTDCAADGRFTLSIPAGAFELRARIAGQLCLTSVTGAVAAGDVRAHLCLVLCPMRDLSGTVSNSEGQPVPGAVIVAHPPRPGAEGLNFGLSKWGLDNPLQRTDADGRFRFEGLPRMPLEVSVDALEYPAQVVQVAAEVEHLNVQLGSMRAWIMAHGQVQDQADQPISNARVRLDSSVGSAIGESDEEGRFRQGLFLPGSDEEDGDSRVTIRISAPGAAPLEQEYPMDNAPEHLFRLAPGLRISGRVVDMSGMPVADARVHLSAANADTLLFAEQNTVTVAGGEFTFDSLAPGRYSLRAFTTRGAVSDASLQEVEAGSDDIELRAGQGAQQAARFTIRIVAAEGGSAIQAVGVQIGAISADIPLLLNSADGIYALPDRAPGPCTFTFEAQGRAPYCTPARDWPAGAHELQVTLHRTRSLRLSLFAEDGRPLAGASVLLSDKSGEPLIGRRDQRPNDPATQAVSGPGGQVFFPALPRREVHFTVSLRAAGTRTWAIDLDRADLGEVVELRF